MKGVNMATKERPAQRCTHCNKDISLNKLAVETTWATKLGERCKKDVKTADLREATKEVLRLYDDTKKQTSSTASAGEEDHRQGQSIFAVKRVSKFKQPLRLQLSASNADTTSLEWKEVNLDGLPLDAKTAIDLIFEGSANASRKHNAHVIEYAMVGRSVAQHKTDYAKKLSNLPQGRFMELRGSLENDTTEEAILVSSALEEPRVSKHTELLQNALAALSDLDHNVVWKVFDVQRTPKGATTAAAGDQTRREKETRTTSAQDSRNAAEDHRDHDDSAKDESDDDFDEPTSNNSGDATYRQQSRSVLPPPKAVTFEDHDHYANLQRWLLHEDTPQTMSRGQQWEHLARDIMFVQNVGSPFFDAHQLAIFSDWSGNYRDKTSYWITQSLQSFAVLEAQKDVLVWLTRNNGVDIQRLTLTFFPPGIAGPVWKTPIKKTSPFQLYMRTDGLQLRIDEFSTAGKWKVESRHVMAEKQEAEIMKKKSAAALGDTKGFDRVFNTPSRRAQIVEVSSRENLRNYKVTLKGGYIFRSSERTFDADKEDPRLQFFEPRGQVTVADGDPNWVTPITNGLQIFSCDPGSRDVLTSVNMNSGRTYKIGPGFGSYATSRLTRASKLQEDVAEQINAKVSREIKAVEATQSALNKGRVERTDAAGLQRLNENVAAARAALDAAKAVARKLPDIKPQLEAIEKLHKQVTCRKELVHGVAARFLAAGDIVFYPAFNHNDIHRRRLGKGPQGYAKHAFQRAAHGELRIKSQRYMANVGRDLFKNCEAFSTKACCGCGKLKQVGKSKFYKCIPCETCRDRDGNAGTGAGQQAFARSLEWLDPDVYSMRPIEVKEEPKEATQGEPASEMGGDAEGATEQEMSVGVF
ncbi:hypothetical protein HDU89_008286 [Geranomyces variabilis]|nr:hypothetical protein HDU89_008286 [Geranomyces variabilis]